MLNVPVYNTEGEKIDTLKVDPEQFGGKVNVALLKQAIVAYHTNKRLGTASTKNRSMVEGSGRKLFRQKGTGYARRGTIRTGKVKGGGVTFAKIPHKPRKKLPKKMRRKALDFAILAKIIGSNILIVDGLSANEPKTKYVVNVLKNLGITRSCLLTLAEHDENLYLSARNIPNVTVRVVKELNAFDVATRDKLLMTREAFSSLLSRPAGVAVSNG